MATLPPRRLNQNRAGDNQCYEGSEQNPITTGKKDSNECPF
jgi:hypothetical protein